MPPTFEAEGREPSGLAARNSNDYRAARAAPLQKTTTIGAKVDGLLLSPPAARHLSHPCSLCHLWSKDNFSRQGKTINSMRPRSNEPATPFDFPELLFWIARSLVYALILFVPWPYGMVEWSWQAWLVPVACLILLLTACGALMRGMNHAQRLIWPLMVILIVSVIQTVPLPRTTMASPEPNCGFSKQS